MRVRKYSTDCSLSDIVAYNLNNNAAMILSSAFTKSGLHAGSSGVVVYPVCEVTPPGPAKYGTLADL
jgi:hypothetical protein